MVFPPPLDFLRAFDWADEVVLHYRSRDAGEPSRIRVWPAIADGEVYVRSPRGTADPRMRRLGRTELVALVDGRPVAARILGTPWTLLVEAREAVDMAFEERYRDIPAFASRITGPRARAATVCLRTPHDHRPTVTSATRRGARA